MPWCPCPFTNEAYIQTCIYQEFQDCWDFGICNINLGNHEGLFLKTFLLNLYRIRTCVVRTSAHNICSKFILKVSILWIYQFYTIIQVMSVSTGKMSQSTVSTTTFMSTKCNLSFYTDFHQSCYAFRTHAHT